MSTGENEQDLRKIIDLTRYLSVVLLLLHFYYRCYACFFGWGLHAELLDRVLSSLSHSSLFVDTLKVKLLTLVLLAISLLGTRGTKDEKHSLKWIVIFIGVGCLIYFASASFLSLSLDVYTVTGCYIAVCGSGYALVIVGATRASRLVFNRPVKDVFNERNETFPQEEFAHTNQYSLNFKARYRLQDSFRDSVISFPNPFRGVLVTGSPGAGKSWFVILPVIKQMISKGYSLFVYDFKFDDLSKPAYNWFLEFSHLYPNKPSFYAINFDDLSTSHRCNPLDPDSMQDISDATEAARTILLGLNRTWITKQGDFFVESCMILVTAIIWFLRKYEDGFYCTLPHVIELMQVEYDTLFPILNSEPEIEVYINPFIIAFENDTTEQLDGQVTSAKVGMARLASPQLYWVLSGNDFTLDINNPQYPKIVCIGNNPEKRSIYGAALSLFMSRTIRLVNRKGKLKSGFIVDEFPTIYVNDVDSLIATARANEVATILCCQDFSQLKKDYGRDLAEVIVNICGNVISGQVFGDTAKQLSERFGKNIQQRDSISINRNDTSLSKSWQLDNAIPASKIASLSSGEFVGMMADNPNDKIRHKMFHAEILQDNDRLSAEMKGFKSIPKVYDITTQEIQDNFHQIKYDIDQLVKAVVAQLKNDRDTEAFQN